MGEWEEIIAGAYKKAGFEEVTLTPRSGDLGRDVIATKRGIGSVRVIDQVKAYTPPRLVTANDVRALAGVLELDGAAKGFVSTTSDFAPKIKSDPLLKKVIPHSAECKCEIEGRPRNRFFRAWQRSGSGTRRAFCGEQER